MSFTQKIQKCEECNKDVKTASREPNDFIASNCFMAPGTAKICQVLTSRNDFIMQNYTVKKWKTIFAARIKIKSKN
jgi:hypothetical protein